MKYHINIMNADIEKCFEYSFLILDTTTCIVLNNGYSKQLSDTLNNNKYRYNNIISLRHLKMNYHLLLFMYNNKHDISD
jgi:hypothetical protein